MKNFNARTLIHTKSKNFLNYISKNNSNINTQKNESKSNSSTHNQENQLNNFYKFMEENIKKTDIKHSNPITDHTTRDDIKYLLNVIKCPITESNLEECEEGLKVSHIIYPKRNGIYILCEEEAQFKF